MTVNLTTERLRCLNHEMRSRIALLFPNRHAVPVSWYNDLLRHNEAEGGLCQAAWEGNVPLLREFFRLPVSGRRGDVGVNSLWIEMEMGPVGWEGGYLEKGWEARYLDNGVSLLNSERGWRRVRGRDWGPGLGWGDGELIQQALRGGSNQNIMFWAPLHLAVLSGQVETVEFLLGEDAELGVRFRGCRCGVGDRWRWDYGKRGFWWEGFDVMHVAICHADARSGGEVLEVLLEEVGRMDGAGRDGLVLSALRSACMVGDVGLVRRLLGGPFYASLQDIPSKDVESNPPILFWALDGYVRGCVKLLPGFLLSTDELAASSTSCPAPPPLPTLEGETLCALVRLLVSNGADPNVNRLGSRDTFVGKEPSFSMTLARYGCANVLRAVVEAGDGGVWHSAANQRDIIRRALMGEDGEGVAWNLLGFVEWGMVKRETGRGGMIPGVDFEIGGAAFGGVLSGLGALGGDRRWRRGVLLEIVGCVWEWRIGDGGSDKEVLEDGMGGMEEMDGGRGEDGWNDCGNDGGDREGTVEGEVEEDGGDDGEEGRGDGDGSLERKDEDDGWYIPDYESEMLL